jgi:hypothetical protein
MLTATESELGRPGSAAIADSSCAEPPRRGDLPGECQRSRGGDVAAAVGVCSIQGVPGVPGTPGTPGPPGPATGSAGGDLTGSYPAPTIAHGAVTPSKIGVVPAARVTAYAQGISNNSQRPRSPSGGHPCSTTPACVTIPPAWTVDPASEHLRHLPGRRRCRLGAECDRRALHRHPSRRCELLLRQQLGAGGRRWPRRGPEHKRPAQVHGRPARLRGHLSEQQHRAHPPEHGRHIPGDALGHTRALRPLRRGPIRNRRDRKPPRRGAVALALLARSESRAGNDPVARSRLNGGGYDGGRSAWTAGPSRHPCTLGCVGGRGGDSRRDAGIEDTRNDVLRIEFVLVHD